MKTIGYGADFQRSADQGTAYATIGECASITPPERSRDTPDATPINGSSGYREFIGGLRDGGEAVAELYFQTGSTGLAALESDFASAEAGYYKIILPDTSDFTFRALISSIGYQTPIDDKVMVPVTFKLTGAPALTLASA